VILIELCVCVCAAAAATRAAGWPIIDRVCVIYDAGRRRDAHVRQTDPASSRYDSSAGSRPFSCLALQSEAEQLLTYLL